MNKKSTKYGLAVLLTITLISILMGFFKIFSTDFFSISKNSKKVEQPAQNSFSYNKDSNYFCKMVNNIVERDEKHLGKIPQRRGCE